MKISRGLARLITIHYVIFPLIPFYIGWMRPAVSIPLILLLFGALIIYIRATDFSEKISVSWRSLLPWALIIGFWLLFSGAGGMGFQLYDYIKCNSVIKDLTENNWPVQYQIDGQRKYLSHYLSFYIVGPATLGIWGYKFAQLGVFLWTALGIYIGTFWVARAVNGLNWKFALFFILFGGITLFSFIFKYHGGFFEEVLKRINEHGYVFWMNSWDIIPLNYLTITDMLYWTPQHFIPVLIGGGLILNEVFIEKNIHFLPFELSLLVMWSPLCLVGLFPFLVYVLFYRRWSGVFNVLNFIIAPILFFVNASYLLSIESNELIKHFIFTDLTDRGISMGRQLGVYIYFLCFEVVAWLILIFISRKTSWLAGEKGFFVLIALVLFLVPLYRFGVWNDWCNRVSMPAMMLLAVFAFKSFIESKGILKLSFMFLLLCSSLAAFIDIIASLQYSGYRPKFNPPTSGQVLSLPESSVSYPIAQFVASEDTFFYKYLAKQE